VKIVGVPTSGEAAPVSIENAPTAVLTGRSGQVLAYGSGPSSFPPSLSIWSVVAQSECPLAANATCLLNLGRFLVLRSPGRPHGKVFSLT
jgi:hypothetical protein